MSTNNSADDKNSNADNVFRRNFAAALGQALREAEDAAPNKKRSQEELTQETYRLLCYDHPVGFTDSGCRALSKALLASLERSGSSNSSRHRSIRHDDDDNNNTSTQQESCFYALSDRLVEGIRQVSYRRAAAKTTNDGGNNSRVEADTENLVASASLTENSNSNRIEEDDSTFASSAFAALTWTVYGRIPLLCCLSTRLDEASSFLGSYRGSGADVDVDVAVADVAVAENAALENGQPDNIVHDDAPGANLTAAQQQQQQPPPAEMNGMNGHAAAPGDDDVSEVWAAESDPSDFDFESEWNPEQNVRELDAWVNELEHGTDPLVQSMVPPNTTWTHVAQAVTNLVHELNYTKVSGLSQHDWKTLKVSDHLTQLVVLLLVVPSEHETTTAPSSSGSNLNSQYPLLNERDANHWQQLALQPLHVLRDAMLSEHDGDTNNKEDDFILKDYLQLLQTLLQVEYNKRGGGCSIANNRGIVESTSQQQFTTTVVPATWIGLSALSTLCSNCLNDVLSNNANRRRITVLRTAVLEASDDLCHILEQSAAGNSEAMRDAIPWTYLSLFQIFSTTTSTGNTNGGATNSTALALPALSNAQIQILLNSGLFRQWLLLWSKLHYGEAENSVVHGAVLQSIFDLCCVAPSLLGKYAWRFPGLAAFATSPSEIVRENDAATTSMDNVSAASSAESYRPLQPHRHQKLRSCFSWNLLGIRLAEETGGGSTSSPTVKWKSSSSSKTASCSSTANAAPPTATVAQQRAWTSFQQLCASVSPVLSAWKDRRCISSVAAKQKPLDEQRAEELALLQLVEDDIRCLSEFNALVDSLSNPALQPLFRGEMAPVTEKLDAGGGSSMILDLTLPIQQELATWPSPLKIESCTKVKTDDSSAEETDHEATSPHQAMRRRVQMEESSINAVRRSIKVLKSILESSPGQSSSIGFSSKAD